MCGEVGSGPHRFETAGFSTIRGSRYRFGMLGRGLLLVGVACAMAAACGGEDFAGGEGGDAGEAHAGQRPAAAGSGASSSAGSATEAGAPAQGGAPAEGGAPSAGAPSQPPSIEIVQTSRTSIVANMDPSLTLMTAPSAGNALIVGITCFSDIENCYIPEGGVSDNQGNAYALVIEGASIVSSDTHGSRGYLFIAENIAEPSGALTITVNPAGMPPDNFQNFAWGVSRSPGSCRRTAWTRLARRRIVAASRPRP